jgi:hypothetical protein
MREGCRPERRVARGRVRSDAPLLRLIILPKAVSARSRQRARVIHEDEHKRSRYHAGAQRRCIDGLFDIATDGSYFGNPCAVGRCELFAFASTLYKLR